MLVLLGASRHTAWKAASFTHGSLRSCARGKRKPDGLFTFNKIILEEIVISQRNFSASSAILASKRIQEVWRTGSVRKEIGELVKLNKAQCNG